MHPIDELWDELHHGKQVVSETSHGLVKLWYDPDSDLYFLNKTTPFNGDTSTEPFQCSLLAEAAALFVLLSSMMK